MLFRSVIETVRDISERKRLESQFIHSQKMEAVGNLASGIAHDFNNLLSVIMGYSALLKMKVYSAPTQLESYADEVINAAERASRLTASLLAFSRKQTLHMKPVDLTTLIREAESFFHVSLRKMLSSRSVCPAMMWWSWRTSFRSSRC